MSGTRGGAVRLSPAVRGTSATVIALAFAGWLAGGLAVGPAAAGTAPGQQLSLVGDGSGRALFDDAEQMSPGAARVRCVRLSAGAATDSDEVRVAATSVSGGLVPWIRLRIDSGTGGGFSSCTGFVGRPVWSGTLAELAAEPTGVPTGWRPREQPVATFRVVVDVTDDLAAMGRSAAADFEWRLTTADVPAGPGAPSPPVSVAPPGAVSPPGDRPVDISPPYARRVLRAFAGIVEEPRPVLWSLAVAGLFLLVQNRFAARDPKLAAAHRAHRELTLMFNRRYDDLVEPV